MYPCVHNKNACVICVKHMFNTTNTYVKDIKSKF